MTVLKKINIKDYKTCAALVILLAYVFLLYFLFVLTIPELLPVIIFVVSLVLIMFGLYKIGNYIFVKRRKKFSLDIFNLIKKSYKDDPWMVCIGFTLLFLAVAEYVHSFLLESPPPAGWQLWLSNLLPIFLSFGLIFKDRRYISAVFLSALIYEVPWNFDFFGRVYANKVVFGGQADYMYSLYYSNKLHFFFNLNHMWLLPISLIGVIKDGIYKNGYLLIGAWSIIINLVTWVLTPAESNINCVRMLCDFGPRINYVLNDFVMLTKIHPLIYLVAWTLLPILVIIFPLNMAFYYLKPIVLKIKKKL